MLIFASTCGCELWLRRRIVGNFGNESLLPALMRCHPLPHNTIAGVPILKLENIRAGQEIENTYTFGSNNERCYQAFSYLFPRFSIVGAEKNDSCGRTPQESRFLLFVLAEKRLSTGSKTSQRLNFAGDNDLGGLTVGGEYSGP